MIACAQTWSPTAQAHFLAMLSEGTTVAKAARNVGVTERSAYAFRRRNEGAIFDLGWRAANLLARDWLHDEMFRRSLRGQKSVVETRIETPDGERSIVSKRQSYDNRLGMAMLTPLDKLAAGDEPGTYVAHLVATDHDAFLARPRRTPGVPSWTSCSGVSLAMSMRPAGATSASRRHRHGCRHEETAITRHDSGVHGVARHKHARP